MYPIDQFYGCPFYMYRAENVADLLVEAMKDERHDRVKYKMMMEMAPNEKVRRQIQFAYDDEGKHYGLFQNIYRQITGQNIDLPVPTVKLADSFLENIETSINGELGAVELYRKIMFMLPSQSMKDTLFEIITDEQEHAARFIYLYSMEK